MTNPIPSSFFPGQFLPLFEKLNSKDSFKVHPLKRNETLSNLPVEVTNLIFRYLEPYFALMMSSANKSMRRNIVLASAQERFKSLKRCEDYFKSIEPHFTVISENSRSGIHLNEAKILSEYYKSFNTSGNTALNVRLAIRKALPLFDLKTAYRVTKSFSAPQELVVNTIKMFALFNFKQAIKLCNRVISVNQENSCFLELIKTLRTYDIEKALHIVDSNLFKISEGQISLESVNSPFAIEGEGKKTQQIHCDNHRIHKSFANGKKAFITQTIVKAFALLEIGASYLPIDSTKALQVIYQAIELSRTLEKDLDKKIVLLTVAGELLLKIDTTLHKNLSEIYEEVKNLLIFPKNQPKSIRHQMLIARFFDNFNVLEGYNIKDKLLDEIYLESNFIKDKHLSEMALQLDKFDSKNAFIVFNEITNNQIKLMTFRKISFNYENYDSLLDMIKAIPRLDPTKVEFISCLAKQISGKRRIQSELLAQKAFRFLAKLKQQLSKSKFLITLENVVRDLLTVYSGSIILKHLNSVRDNKDVNNFFFLRIMTIVAKCLAHRHPSKAIKHANMIISLLQEKVPIWRDFQAYYDDMRQMRPIFVSIGKIFAQFENVREKAFIIAENLKVKKDKKAIYSAICQSILKEYGINLKQPKVVFMPLEWFSS